ncbi:MAG: ParB/RepB/Spo0J family partition protein [Patulibacter sp.]|nr:ParB/RepB/Spo0J family partition protein [Patulibacter sp.]
MPVTDIYELDRHRRDLGDIDGLVASIADVGLLQPLVVAPDGRLIAGGRRLAAIRSLGWNEVAVNVADSLTDAAALLRAERDENVVRKSFTASEIASIGAALEATFKPAAEERMTAGVGNPEAPGPQGRAPQVRDEVGQALGVSGKTYERIRTVADDAADEALPEPQREAARETLDALDAGAPVRPTVDEYKRGTQTHVRHPRDLSS